MTTHPSDRDSRGSKSDESDSQGASGETSAGRGDEGRGFREGRRHRHRGHRARKERVLHTRISEQLSEDIREFAEDLRVPASNLVRNVLEEVFTVVNSVSGDVGHLMDDLIEEAEGVRDRVRRQARSSRSGSRFEPRGARRSRRGESSNHTDVEEELRRDEEREFRSAPRRASTGTDASESSSRGGTEGEEPASAAELFPQILGWQPLVLNRDFDCGRCKRVLRAGESAFLGMSGAGMTEVALCGRCAGRGRGRE